MMGRRKLPYREGDWIVVPIDTRGFGVGRIVRSIGNGVVLGYFFAPLWKRLPKLHDTTRLSRENAILVTKFGDLGLLEGAWKALGHDDGWNRQDWPVPIMYRQDVISGVWRATEYRDDLKGYIREWKIEGEPPVGFCYDVMHGYVALEITLAKLLK